MGPGRYRGSERGPPWSPGQGYSGVCGRRSRPSGGARNGATVLNGRPILRGAKQKQTRDGRSANAGGVGRGCTGSHDALKIQHWLGRESRRPAEEQSLKKVLVVDDAEVIRVEVARALSPAGFIVLEAA